MNRQFLLGLAVTVPLALVLSGCNEEQPARVLTTVTVTQTTGEEPIAEESTASEPTGDEESDVPEGTANLGDTVEVGDWAVRVTDVEKKADKTIKKANPFNDKPKGQFVLVTYEATYNGKERTADAWADLAWTLTTNDNKILNTAFGVTPAENQDLPTSARAGGTVEAQVLFDVEPKTLPGSILSVEGYTADFDDVYADFIIN